MTLAASDSTNDRTSDSNGWTGSRRLLRLLRDLIRGEGASQDRLDKAVDIVSKEFHAEVCSIYVMRADETLELYASIGLNAAAVHRTRLRVGEGLVGEIAARALPFALADAQAHPSFAYRPETGEEAFVSLVGVPILQNKAVLGVLVVQNKTARDYTEAEVEGLETLAIVLAEMLATGARDGVDTTQRGDAAAVLPARFSGIALTAGLAVGRVVEHRRGVVPGKVVAEDPENELARLQTALENLRASIDTLLLRHDVAAVGEHREILETYRMFSEDRGWLGRIHDAVHSGLTAEAAVQKVRNDTRARMDAIKDPYLRERAADLDDLGDRLLRHLLGEETGAPRALPEDAVLLARDLGPADLLDYDLERLRAVVLEEGSPMAHMAIIARSLELPVMGRCRGVVSQAREGDTIIVDADNEQVLLRPNQSVVDSFTESMDAMARRRAEYAAVRDLPPVTRDGLRISLSINAGLLIDLQQMHASGADGIGLYRTEIPFMVRDSLPDVDEQTELYKRVLDQARDKSVVFRTLDIGGDKILPYWRGATDENPAMGWRAIRIGIDRPVMLRQQLRALLRAAAGRELNVMFPMVSEVAEFESARTLMRREIEREEGQGAPLPEKVNIGVMLEVPALAWQLPALLERCHFISIGSNDLFQFLFACDRGNPRVARRYDNLSPAVLSFLRSVVAQADAAGCTLSLCGEMAGSPLEAMALVGCGLRKLSMPPPAVGPVKTMLRSLYAEPLRDLVSQLAELPDHSVREQLRAYAIDHEIAI